LRVILPRKTFYRYRKQLQEHGIDIAVRQPHEDRSNVVPLMRVLEAKPAPIPDWAYGTHLLFEPRLRA
jgi:II/X family phage/plasmid replication protein